ncbi:Uncharacterised protein [Enterobacter cloacae]|nr:hypothetical protein AI2797V1_1928 [Enterobacter cloacae]CAE7806847.1 hypothetical protein AI2802V1_1926 [Enterobacter cloacae]CAH3654750.1 hypothetical protein AI2797V1_1928 [Enterobacter cloacae]CAH3957977.1 hypothetical protein AI2802V1_1926 [Enterobacter cloacae]CZY16574.1 Uncharacterised protein [Enterobacter cloacae]
MVAIFNLNKNMSAIIQNQSVIRWYYICINSNRFTCIFGFYEKTSSKPRSKVFEECLNSLAMYK